MMSGDRGGIIPSTPPPLPQPLLIKILNIIQMSKYVLFRRRIEFLFNISLWCDYYRFAESEEFFNYMSVWVCVCER